MTWNKNTLFIIKICSSRIYLDMPSTEHEKCTSLYQMCALLSLSISEATKNVGETVRELFNIKIMLDTCYFLYLSITIMCIKDF